MTSLDGTEKGAGLHELDLDIDSDLFRLGLHELRGALAGRACQEPEGEAVRLSRRDEPGPGGGQIAPQDRRLVIVCPTTGRNRPMGNLSQAERRGGQNRLAI